MKDLNLEYPAMLYRPDGSDIEWDGKPYDTLIVADAEEAEIALADGWMLAADAAKGEAPKRLGRPPKAD